MTPITCANPSCAKARAIMIEMEPGRDRKPWRLCSVCWLECLQKWKLGNISAAYAAEP